MQKNLFISFMCAAALVLCAASTQAQSAPSEAAQRMLDRQKAKEAERCANEPAKVLNTISEMIRFGDVVTAENLLKECPTLPASKAKPLSAQLEKLKKSQATGNNPKNHGVTIGMTQEQALASNWGKPQSVNTTTTAHGVREQWVYGGRSYLYFTNGKLTSIQN